MGRRRQPAPSRAHRPARCLETPTDSGQVINLTPRAAFASEAQLARGTFYFSVVAVNSLPSADGNLLITQTLQGRPAGDVAGSVEETEHLVVHPTGEVEFRGIDVCSCTVAGRSGTFVDGFEGHVASDGTLTSTVRGISSGGGLAGLHFEGRLAGPTTGPNAGSYAVRLHFDP